jgi:hypothetical protein
VNQDEWCVVVGSESRAGSGSSIECDIGPPRPTQVDSHPPFLGFWTEALGWPLSEAYVATIGSPVAREKNTESDYARGRLNATHNYWMTQNSRLHGFSPYFFFLLMKVF